MKFLIALAATLPLVSFATNAPTPTPTPAPSAAAAAGSTAAAQARSASSAKATSAANVAVDAKASNEGNTLSVVNEDRLQAPALGLAPVYASGPCNSGWSLGGSVPGYAMGGGKTRPDVNCDRREIVRILTALNPALALKVACADPLVAAVAEAGDCVFSPAPPEVIYVPLESASKCPPAPDLEALERRFDEKLRRQHTSCVSK